MGTDYKKLCSELFGTDNVDELRELAHQLQQIKNNPRNAGRKRLFDAVDIKRMEQLRNGGMSVNEIAQQYHTSRQMIGRYLNNRPQQGCTMRMTYMFRRQPCTVIDLDFLNRNVYIENKTDDLLHRAFGANIEPKWQDFEDFLSERCFPKTRGNCRRILEELGLTDYDPLQIVERTKGRIADDNMWIKINYYQREVAAGGKG